MTLDFSIGEAEGGRQPIYLVEPILLGSPGSRALGRSSHTSLRADGPITPFPVHNALQPHYLRQYRHHPQLP